MKSLFNIFIPIRDFLSSKFSRNKGGNDSGEWVALSPLMMLVRGLLATAIRSGAQEISFHQAPGKFLITGRTGGELHTIPGCEAPANLGNEIINQLIHILQMDVLRSSEPQEGRATLVLEESHEITGKYAVLGNGERSVVIFIPREAAEPVSA